MRGIPILRIRYLYRYISALSIRSLAFSFFTEEGILGRHSPEKDDLVGPVNGYTANNRGLKFYKSCDFFSTLKMFFKRVIWQKGKSALEVVCRGGGE